MSLICYYFKIRPIAQRIRITCKRITAIIYALLRIINKFNIVDTIEKMHQKHCSELIFNKFLVDIFIINIITPKC